MNSYSNWLAELTTLNQRLQSLAQQEEWQQLEETVTDYLHLAATSPDCTADERQQCQSGFQRLFDAHQCLTLQIHHALQQAGKNLSHGRQQQQLLQAYFSV